MQYTACGKEGGGRFFSARLEMSFHSNTSSAILSASAPLPPCPLQIFSDCWGKWYMTEMINIPKLRLTSGKRFLKRPGWLCAARALSRFVAVLYINTDNRHSILKKRSLVKQTLRNSSVPKPET